MKLNNLTKTLINLILILLIALLMKFLVTTPKQTYAQVARPSIARLEEYKVVSPEEEFASLLEEEGKSKLGTEWLDKWDKMTTSEKLTYMFNWNSRRGWKYHNFIIANEALLLVFVH